VARTWTRLAEKRWRLRAACDNEFYAIRSDARFCSARCRQRFCRSKDNQLERLKRLGKKHAPGSGWKQERKAFEARITQTLVGQDSEGLANAFYEMREAAQRVWPRWTPYRSFAGYCRGRWYLDPEEIERLINPWLNPILWKIKPAIERRRPTRESRRRS